MAASGETKEIRTLLEKDVFDWSVADVARWIDHIGLAQYKQLFIENAVSGISVTELDVDDLKLLGLERLGDRKTFLRALRRLIDKPGSQSGSASGHSSGSGSADDADSWDTQSNGSHKSTGSHHSRNSRKSSASGSSKKSAKFSKHLVKAYYRERTKIFEIAKDSSASELREAVKKQFGKRMTVSWKDADGDKIQIRSTRGWNTCKKISGERVRVWCHANNDSSTSRKQNEMKTLHSLSDPVICIDAQGRILTFNPAAETFFGYKTAAVVGSKVNILMPDDVAETHDGFLKRYIETGEKHVIGKGRRVLALKRNGEQVPVFLTISETHSRKRTERQFIGTLQDLSGGRTEESVIKEDQTAAYTILQNILDAAVVIDKEGSIKFFNTAAEDLFGHSAKNVVGKNVSMLMHGKDKREHNNYLASYFKTGKQVVIGKGREVVAALADGSLKAVHLSVTQQDFSGGQTLFTGIIRPVDQVLEEANSKMTVLEQLRDVLDNLMIAAVIADDTGKILAFNESAEELLGWKLVKILGQNVKVLCPPEHAINHDGYIQRWKETGEEHVFGVGRNLSARHTSGEIIPVRLAVTKRLDETGRFLLTATFQRL